MSTDHPREGSERRVGGAQARCRLRRIIAWRFATAVAVLAVTVVVAACTGGNSERSTGRTLRIAAGNPGGVYVAYADGLAQAVDRHLPGLSATVVETGGSVANLRLVADRQADIGFALADASAAAVMGSAPFDRPLDIVAIARLYDNYVQVVARLDGGIQNIWDLRGRRVSTGASGSGTDLVADRVLDAAHLTGSVRTVNLDLLESSRALAEGELDALFFSGGLPTGAIETTRNQTPIHLVDLDDVGDILAEEYEDLYVVSQVPPSIYDLPEPVTTISVPNYLVVRRDADPGMIYELTKLLFRSRPEISLAHPEARRLNLRSAISTMPLDLHPGAVRYFREAAP